MLTVGSLFSGIGGIELGLERTGYFKTVWQVENASYPFKVSKRHWPEVSRYGDVKEVTNKSYQGDRFIQTKVSYADLICGGFPCQDISNAGKRAGIEGKRSGLWSEMARLVGEIRPKYVLVENVSALLSRGIDRVLGDLATLGYDAEWDCIPASAIGANHQRDRVFIVAYTSSNGLSSQKLREFRESNDNSQTGQKDASKVSRHSTFQKVADSKHRNVQERRIFNRTITKTFRETSNGFGNGSPVGRGWWSTEPDVGRVAHGVPNRVDRLKCLGNAVVPQVAEAIGYMIKEHHERNNRSD